MWHSPIPTLTYAKIRVLYYPNQKKSFFLWLVSCQSDQDMIDTSSKDSSSDCSNKFVSSPCWTWSSTMSSLLLFLEDIYCINELLQQKIKHTLGTTMRTYISTPSCSMHSLTMLCLEHTQQRTIKRCQIITHEQNTE